ncbi:MAG: DNA-directed RNA polymerase subunit beta' [Clostridia bacterium]|nr:DNA-directed RNA polymerase subunit beta' [Clostridia bacterium]
MFELNNFDSMQIGVASPEKIISWSNGEVTKPETINYRTQKPEPEGLFCEKIFGPTKDYECRCGKYKRVRYKGVVCDKCGVEVTKSKVRRERMGHIALAAPVSHIWYFRGVPSRIGTVLDVSPKDLDQVIYFTAYIVLDPGATPLLKKQVITDREYNEYVEKYGEGSFRVGMGAEAVKELLEEVDLDAEAEILREQVNSNAVQKRNKAVKRLEVIEAFRKSGNKPSWMILDVIPVIPPELRPMVPLDGGRYATSDLNDLYRRVINRNNRLKKLLEIGAPEMMINNEKRMLQEAVDSLIDNGRRGKAVTGPNGRELKSLSKLLSGKQGRFRQNLLGKRVDYSGRSVIVVGPELKMYQCGLPKEMAVELFKPFIMKELVSRGLTHNIKTAKNMIDRTQPVVWDILEEVIKDHPVMLNRAPTLHRLGIQAFEPVLVEGRAIKLHPLVCTAFNADFDGDQMAVHVPLSIEAQAEARFLMLSTNNILKLSDGKPIVCPTQDMVLGSFYLTKVRPGAKGEGMVFSSKDEAIMAYQTKNLDLEARVKIRFSGEYEGETVSKLIETTVGRVIYNDALPQDLHFVNRDSKETFLDLEVEAIVAKSKHGAIGKKELSNIVDACFKYHGATETSIVLDNIKALGFKYSTVGALTTSIFDMTISPEKKVILEEAEKQLQTLEKQFKRGLLTDEERYEEVIKLWQQVADDVEKATISNFDEFNPIRMMADSGARGSARQIRQLSGMRGLMADPTGKTIELPVKASFREGLTVLEYFISSHGARKGLADTALRTASSGYLTRRLVDVSQDVIVREDDCGDTKGVWATEIVSDGVKVESLKDRVFGRYTLEDVINPATGEVIVAKDEMISEDQAKAIEDAGITKVHIRTVLSCKSKYGVCAKCYGRNLAGSGPVRLGEAIGVIAAQSIGEPGTQLTMRTFHSGGVATADDITQGLPRVEELFETRTPKRCAIVSDIAGTVSVAVGKRDLKEVTVTSPDNKIVKVYPIPFNAKLLNKIVDGYQIQPGEPLTHGSIWPQDLLRTKGVAGVEEYILCEVKNAYRSSGVDIADKHIEVIIKQMLRRVRIETQGDTDMLPGELVDIIKYDEENQRVLEAGGVPATAKRTLLPIRKAALASDSFLSAASFQETAKVLTEAAIKNKVDPLVGLKENVIIGKLIPAGTGMKLYRGLGPARAEKND